MFIFMCTCVHFLILIDMLGVAQFMCWSSVVTVDARPLQDFKVQIKKADVIFVELYPLWLNKNILMKFKIHTFLLVMLNGYCCRV